MSVDLKRWIQHENIVIQMAPNQERGLNRLAEGAGTHRQGRRREVVEHSTIGVFTHPFGVAVAHDVAEVRRLERGLRAREVQTVAVGQTSRIGIAAVYVTGAATGCVLPSPVMRQLVCHHYGSGRKGFPSHRGTRGERRLAHVGYTGNTDG